MDKHFPMKKEVTRWKSTLLYATFVTIQAQCCVQCCVFCEKNFVGVFLSPYGMRYGASVNSSEYLESLHLINTVSSEFKTIIIELDDIQKILDVEEIATTIANWNLQRTTVFNKDPINILLYQKYDVLENIENIRYLIERINQISEETVTELILHKFLRKLDSNDFQNNLMTYRNLGLRKNFKLGLSFSPEESIRHPPIPLKKMKGIINNSFDMIDSIYFEISRTPASSTSSVEAFVRAKLRLANSTFNIYRESTNKNFVFGAIGSWPDTTDEGEIDYRKLVYFWRNLTDMGQLYNFRVLLKEAFDTFHTEPPSQCSMGWWAIQNHISPSQISKFEFEDKMIIAQKENAKSTKWFISHMSRDISFDKDHILAEYNLSETMFYLKRYEMPLHQLLTIFVDKMASKFARMFVVYEAGLASTRYQQIEILSTVIAKRNLQLPLSFIKLSISVDIKYKEEIQNLAKSLIRANEIKPGSVTQVLLFSKMLEDFSSSINVIQELVSAETSNEIQTCLHLNIDICLTLNRYVGGSHSALVFEIVNCIFFRYFPGTRKMGHRYGLDRVTSQVIRVFEHCKHQANILLPGVLVGFETTYYSPPKLASQDFPSAFIFWKKINTWATTTKTQVILHNAFDPVNGTGSKESSNSALWRVKTFNNGSSGIQFEEKRIGTLKQLHTLVSQPDLKSDGIWLELSVLATLVAVVALLAIWQINKRLKQSKQKDNFLGLQDTEILNQNTVLLQASSFSPDSSKVLGKGNFGVVYKCFMPEFETIVAVKTVTSEAFEDEHFALRCIIAEIKAMSRLDQHPNILQMIGACVKGTVFLVTEYCENGSLLTYIQTQSLKKFEPSNYELLQYCCEIANGMCYLKKSQMIHGDLAARNILLNKDMICKISDFGLSRHLELYEIYVKKGEEPLPWRWMAPESLMRKEFSYKSDIWSMGITFWEVYTLGKIPYAEMEWDGTFCDKLTDGHRLEKPKLADENFYKILRSCWELNAGCRPQAQEILHEITKLKLSEYVVV